MCWLRVFSVAAVFCWAPLGVAKAAINHAWIWDDRTSECCSDLSWMQAIAQRRRTNRRRHTSVQNLLHWANPSVSIKKIHCKLLGTYNECTMMFALYCYRQTHARTQQGCKVRQPKTHSEFCLLFCCAFTYFCSFRRFLSTVLHAEKLQRL